ncbi:MAG: helix-turn-helix transcriptional regulator [Planctomycetota bacterium JB042]
MLPVAKEAPTAPSFWTRELLDMHRANDLDATPRLLLSVNEVADLLGCSIRHVHRLVAERKAPSPIRLGASARWRRSDLEQWVEEGCPPLTGEQGEGVPSHA